VVHIYGVVPTTLRSLLERTVFRIARGNIYMTWKDNTSSDIVSVTPDASTGALAADITVPPTLSFSFKLPPGSELYKRILRTCQTIGARVYDIPQTTNPGDIETVLARVDEEAGRQLHARMQTTAVLQQLFQVAATESTSVEAAEETGAPQLLLSEWQALVLQERHITLALSQAERSTQGASTVCVLRAWVPSHRMDCLEAGLAASVQGTDVLPPLLQVPNDGQIAEGANPPTRFDTTCFWLPFQMMVDTYGVPTYKEANPGLVAAVTFPFLFGVMFGDVFHGACLAIAGAIGLTIFRGRYRAEHEDGVDETATPYAHEKVPAQAKLHVGLWMMLLLMGLFAVYAGLIYNDCAALPLHMGVSPLLDDKSHGPYSFGIDPGYYHTASELPVLNSFKMKMSVIIGVLHMTFGLGIGVSNHLYRGRTHMLWLESVPRITLLMATFGYMISIIVYKWTVD
jgi:V-type H+-transporting ATPase subunit a